MLLFCQKLNLTLFTLHELFNMTSTENNAKPSKKDKKQKTKVKVFTKKKKRNEPESEFIKKLQEKYATIDTANIKTFVDLPLCPKTLKGLKESGYLKPTEIQRDCIGLSLQGKDVLGAAQTGSGKTLAFIIPILEKLYCMQWSRYDGVGALVITPTRELAYQIFEALRRVGQHHDFSAGLIIGGKDLKFERNRMDQCNIVICTPGRLLQHMDENPLFDCTNMQILVLDEADRCLDMGFQQTMNAIIANLPPQRQTLLFSATQTKSVKDLARLSLKDPSYVSVHEHAKFSTPAGLEQSYMVCELHEKMSVLWSFIKNHLKKKIIIFFSTCKQVKYTYEMFCKLRPGVSLLALYGTLHQLRRMDIYEEFCRKQSAVLFATDLVARGLDFPEVHWVVQADCPEDPETYIHRVGRTARYHRGGESLLLLQPSELAMLDKLKDKKIPISKIDINQDRLKNPVQKMEAFLVSTPGLKDVAQRAFVNYVKSVFLMKDKEVFKVDEIDTVEYAKSLGLTNPPRVRFIERFNKAQDAKESKTKSFNSAPRENKIVKFDNSDEEEDKDEDEGFSGEQTKATISGFNISDDEGDDDFLAVERRDNDIELPTEMEMVQQEMGRSVKGKPITKAAVAKKMLRKLNVVPNKKITFDAEGEAVVETTKKMQSELAQEYENEDYGGIDIEKAMLVRKEEDKFDKLLFKEKVKAMKREKKKKLKAKKSGEDEEEQDDFGEDSDDEPDLSWLPDPDKIYGRKDSDDEGDKQDDDDIVRDDSGNEEDAREVVKEKRKKSKKRKQADQKLQEKPKKKKKKLEKGISESLTVNEAEELAMLLLRNK